MKNITSINQIKYTLMKSIKKLLILVTIFASSQIIAQAPEKTNYQVVVRDATGNNLITPTGSNSMKIE